MTVTRDPEKVRSGLADFDAAVAALEGQVAGKRLGGIGVATVLQLDPAEGARRLRLLPPELAMIALRQTAAEGLPPAPETARAANEVLAAYRGEWAHVEVALACWAGMPGVDQRLLSLHELDRWRSVAFTLEWGVPADWAEGEAFAKRLLTEAPSIDRARLALLRARPDAPLAEVSALIERIETATLRLEAIYELARRTPEPGENERVDWLASAIAAAESPHHGIVSEGQIEARTSAVLARCEAPIAATWLARAEQAIERLQGTDRVALYVDLLRATAVIGAMEMRAIVERVSKDPTLIALGDARADLALCAAEAMEQLHPKASADVVFPAMTELTRRLGDAPKGLPLLALLVRAGARSGVRPTGTWIEAIRMRLRKLHTTPIVPPATIIRSARILATEDWDLARGLADELSDGLQRGLFLLGRLQALIRPL